MGIAAEKKTYFIHGNKKKIAKQGMHQCLVKTYEG